MKTYLDETLLNCKICKNKIEHNYNRYKTQTCSKECAMKLTGEKRRYKTLQELYAIKNFCVTCNNLIPHEKAFKNNKIGINQDNLICLTNYKNLKTCSKTCQSLNQIFKTNNLNSIYKKRIIEFAKSTKKNNEIIKYIAKKISSIKTRSEKRNFDFNLDLYYLLQTLTPYCPITHKEFIFCNIKRNEKNIFQEFMPTINRIDSKKGYIKGNIEWLSWKANRIINDADLYFFEQIVKHKKQQEKFLAIDKNYLACYSSVDFV